MLIVCIGPDNYRALAKAQELEKAFIEKHDPSAVSVEHLVEGAGMIEAIIERVNTASLFSPRRFIRVSDLLSSCAKAKQKALVQALGKDAERIIVVTVEREAPTETVMSVFAEVPKYVRYDFSALSGKDFLAWANQCAETLGIVDKAVVQRLAQYADGDAWLVANELQKIAAGGEQHLTEQNVQQGIFQYSDAYLSEAKDRYTFLLDDEAVRQSLTMFLSQARAALRVRDGSTSGLHPYVVKKMQKAYPHLEEKHAQTLLTLFLQRAGYGVDQEVAALL